MADEYHFETAPTHPDYAAFLPLIRSELPPEKVGLGDDELLDAMEQSHSDETDTVRFLKTADGELAGYYRYSLWPRDATRTYTVHLMDIAVDPRYRRLGLGLRLMDDLFAECRRRGFIAALSHTVRTNTASIELHRKVGFVVEFEKGESIVWRRNLV